MGDVKLNESAILLHIINKLFQITETDNLVTNQQARNMRRTRLNNSIYTNRVIRADFSSESATFVRGFVDTDFSTVVDDVAYGLFDGFAGCFDCDDFFDDLQRFRLFDDDGK